MPYDRLGRRLAGGDSPAFATLPDGSIDRYCTLLADGGDPLRTRRAFGREIRRRDRSTFRVRVEATEPGGQAVNTARQLHALGGDVTCYGHLDAPIFESLPFETVSMGEPADVYAFNFADSDVMFAENSAVVDWTLADLRAAADLRAVFAVDAACCANWVSFPGMEQAFHALGDATLPRVPFVVDPGDVNGLAPDAIDALHRSLAALQETFDVIYNANRREIRATAAPLGSSGNVADLLEDVRDATGITAAVMHGRDEAVAATPDGRTRVENYVVERAERHTGGGDRFTGGLSYGLANGWDWDLALACGNACAVHYVETGATGDSDDVVDFLDSRPQP